MMLNARGGVRRAQCARLQYGVRRHGCTGRARAHAARLRGCEGATVTGMHQFWGDGRGLVGAGGAGRWCDVQIAGPDWRLAGRPAAGGA